MLVLGGEQHVGVLVQALDVLAEGVDGHRLARLLRHLVHARQVVYHRVVHVAGGPAARHSHPVSVRRTGYMYIAYMFSRYTYSYTLIIHSATQNLSREPFISLSNKQPMLTPNLPSEFFQHVTVLCYDVTAFLVTQLMFCCSKSM